MRRVLLLFNFSCGFGMGFGVGGVSSGISWRQTSGAGEGTRAGSGSVNGKAWPGRFGAIEG